MKRQLKSLWLYFEKKSRGHIFKIKRHFLLESFCKIILAYKLGNFVCLNFYLEMKNYFLNCWNIFYTLPVLW